MLVSDQSDLGWIVSRHSLPNFIKYGTTFQLNWGPKHTIREIVGRQSPRLNYGCLCPTWRSSTPKSTCGHVIFVCRRGAPHVFLSLRNRFQHLPMYYLLYKHTQKSSTAAQLRFGNQSSATTTESCWSLFPFGLLVLKKRKEEINHAFLYAQLLPLAYPRSALDFSLISSIWRAWRRINWPSHLSGKSIVEWDVAWPVIFLLSSDLSRSWSHYQQKSQGMDRQGLHSCCQSHQTAFPWLRS